MAYTTINKSSEYFDTKLHDGTGVAKTLAYDFEVDMYWTKMRNDVYPHMIFDAVRGNNNRIRPNQTNGEGSAANTVSFGNSSGISLGTDSGNYGVNKAQNDSSQTAQYVGWGWKANGAGSANTDGSINSTVSANTTAGFSVVKFTATGSNLTVGHGLGVAPKMIITKNLSITKDWSVYHSSLGAGKSIFLNTTAAADTDNTYWYNTAPTSTTFSYGTWSGNNNGNEIIAYCFAEKTGYSKIGSYVGNNNQDGPFIYTGFKPAFVLFKRSSDVENWSLYDNKRATEYNPTAYGLRPNISNIESAYGAGGAAGGIDILSNGFKIREGGTNINTGTYIYITFGQSLVGSNNIPCTAR